VKNAALMNVMQMEKGKERWSMLDENTWGMLLGKSGQLVGELAPEIKALATQQKREYFEGNPQDLYPDVLDEFRKKMDEKGWDYGQDDEELLEYAMHPPQYEAFKSGKAKKDFLADLEKRKAAKAAKTNAISAVPIPIPASSNNGSQAAPYQPKQLELDINGEKYKVSISYDNDTQETANNVKETTTQAPLAAAAYPQNDGLRTITAPLEGKFYLTKDSSDIAVKVGDKIKEGQTVAYIESMKVINSITSDKSGTIVEILGKHGEEIEEDDVIIKLQ